MSKSLYTTHNVFKIFGIKVFEYYSDYVGNETTENVETIRDDIILHENIIRKRSQN